MMITGKMSEKMIHQKEYGIDSNQTHSKKNVAMILYAIYAATVFIYEDFSVPLFVIGIFICIIVLYLLYYHFVNKTKIMVSGTNIYILLLVMCMIANIRTILSLIHIFPQRIYLC